MSTFEDVFKLKFSWLGLTSPSLGIKVVGKSNWLSKEGYSKSGIVFNIGLIASSTADLIT